MENFPRTQNVVGGDRLLKKKLVLNDGVLLCDIWKSGELDPRREASSHITQLKRLELPPWAYRWQEEKNDSIHKMRKVIPYIRWIMCLTTTHKHVMNQVQHQNHMLLHPSHKFLLQLLRFQHQGDLLSLFVDMMGIKQQKKTMGNSVSEETNQSHRCLQ